MSQDLDEAYQAWWETLSLSQRRSVPGGLHGWRNDGRQRHDGKGPIPAEDWALDQAKQDQVQAVPRRLFVEEDAADLYAALLTGQPGVEAEAASSDEVMKAYRRLAAEHREAILACLKTGQTLRNDSLRAVAKELGISEATLRRRVKTALSHLEKQVSDLR